ncbi:MAG: hypothetical protein IJV32_02110 [Bacteroidales bacterium]|nr:hypothetical protein [Bacteroidales bacterium]
MKFRYFALAAAVLAAACGKTPETTPQEVTLTTPPDPSAKTVCVDAPLTLELSSTPVLGTSGYIRVFRKDGTKVDEINLSDISKTVTLEDGTMIPAGADADAGKIAIGDDYVFHTFMDALHSGQYRVVHYTPLRIKGKTLEIKLHNEALSFGESYYVTVDESVVGKAVAAEDMPFTVKARPSGTTLSVKADGTGDFCTVQGALSYASTLSKDADVVIEIGEGRFEELLFLRNKNNVTLRGASRSGTVIAYPNNDSYETGSGSSVSSKPSVGHSIGKSGGRSVFLVENCDNLVLENLTLENTYSIPSHKGQAEAIYFNDGSNSRKLTIESCNLLSWQDTFLTKGKVWVHGSLIAGHVDYIWGYPDVCLFEDCEIRSRAGGYIVQARVPSGCKGFVFLNCKLTAESGVKDGAMELARSGGSTDYYDNVVFVNCTMSPVIASAGWHTNPAPNPSAPTATSGWREYGSKTPAGTAVTGHNSYGKVLTAAEAEPYLTRQSILGW